MTTIQLSAIQRKGSGNEMFTNTSIELKHVYWPSLFEEWTEMCWIFASKQILSQLPQLLATIQLPPIQRKASGNGKFTNRSKE